jgi:ribosomal-protein-alanine N-acetyltransferase
VSLLFSPLSEEQARSILQWQYEPPWDMYNMLGEGQTLNVGVLTGPDKNYYAITDESGELLAYCCFGQEGRVPGGNYDSPALDVGMGIRPDLIGQGLGRRYLEAIREFAIGEFSPTIFRVTIAAFNARALRLCEQAGFRQTQRFLRENDGLAFVILTRSV